MCFFIIIPNTIYGQMGFSSLRHTVDQLRQNSSVFTRVLRFGAKTPIFIYYIVKRVTQTLCQFSDFKEDDQLELW